MATLIYNDVEKILEDDSPIIDSCKEIGVPFGCKDGLCGSCAIEIAEGLENLSSRNEKESAVIKDHVNIRLACQCSIKSGNVRIGRFV